MHNMTGSARGTAEALGRNLAQKAGLNRSILDTAPAGYLNMLRYKAEEAGAEFLEAKTRELKPSQRCPDCGAVRKKTLAERHHDCDCGCRLGRDEAAALVLLRWELAQLRHCQNEETINPVGTVGDQAAA
ncbi:transposase [Thioclava sp. JE_KL1]|nr:transposase [Thioclava sp. JE_KL1]